MNNIKTLKLVVSHFYPEINALTNRLDSFLPTVTKYCKVKVVYLLLPDKKFNLDELKERYANLEIDYFPVKSKGYDKNSFFKRIFGETINSIKLWREARSISSDITYVSIPQLMLLPISGIFIPYDNSKRKILELRDLTWEYISFGSGRGGTILSSMLEKIALWSIRKFDEVVTCTVAQAEFIKVHTDKKVEVVRNGISEKKFNQLSELKFKAEKDSFVLGYFGTIGYAQNLIVLAQAAKRIKNKSGIKILIVGSGPEKKKIENYIVEHNLLNVEIHDRVSWDKLLKLYERCSVLFAPLKKDIGLEKAEPSKIFEYLATGKHLLYAGEGVAAELSREFINATVITPDSEKKLAEKILFLQGNPPIKCEKDIQKIKKEFVRENIFEDYINRVNIK